MDDDTITIKIYYGGVLVREPTTQYRDFECEIIKWNKNNVCLWSISKELSSYGLSDDDIKAIYYREARMSLDMGLKLLYDAASLFGMFSTASRMGFVEIYVEHTDEWLRSNNKLVSVLVNNTLLSNSNLESERDKTWEQNRSCFRIIEEGLDKVGGLDKAQTCSDGEEEETCSDGDKAQTCSEGEEDDLEDELEEELDDIDETIPPNVDDELRAGINAVREFYQWSITNSRLPSTANYPPRNAEIVNENSESEDDRDDNEFDNSSVGSLEEKIEEDGTIELRRRAVRFPRYDENCKEVSFFIGQAFTDHTQFKRALLRYAVQEKRDYKFLKNGKNRVRVNCLDSRCSWMVYAAKEDHHRKIYFLVKTLREKHSCLQVFKISRIKAPWIASEFESMIYAHPGIKPSFIAHTIQVKLQLEFYDSQCKRAKSMVISKLERDVNHEYARLYDYARTLEVNNPCSSIDIEVENKGGKVYFKRMYVCFSAIREGFLEGCRRYLGLDGCFLKGVVKGQLLTAVGKDANNQMFPLAWAQVEVESEASWTWFLEHLTRDIRAGDGSGWCFMLDQQKGLLNVVAHLFPRAEHRLCARHIYGNWNSDFRNERLKLAFYAVAKSPNQAHLQRRLEEIERIKEGAKATLENTDITQWCKAYFRSISKCDSVDNNSTEAFNFVLISARSKPIISMFEMIRVYVMQRRVSRIAFVSKWRTNCGKNVREIVQENTAKSFDWKTKWNGEDGYEVGEDGYEVTWGKTQYRVKLRDKSCSCNGWELSGIPCTHAIAAIRTRDEDPTNYLSSWYDKEMFLCAYKYPIEPMASQEFWDKTGRGELAAPLPRPMPGRPKKARFKRKNEPRKSKTKLSRHGRTMHCSSCKDDGHNKRTCPYKDSVLTQQSVHQVQYNQPGMPSRQIPNAGRMAYTQENAKKQKRDNVASAATQP